MPMYINVGIEFRLNYLTKEEANQVADELRPLKERFQREAEAIAKSLHVHRTDAVIATGYLERKFVERDDIEDPEPE